MTTLHRAGTDDALGVAVAVILFVQPFVVDSMCAPEPPPQQVSTQPLDVHVVNRCNLGRAEMPLYLLCTSSR